MSRFRLRRSSRSAILSAPVTRIAIIALAIYALGLIPFFLIPPVHQAVLGLFRPESIAQTRSGRTPTSRSASPTPLIGAAATPKATPNDSTVVTAQSTAAPGETPAPIPVQLEGGSHFAFLLLGYGGEGHDGPYLTDSMMLVIVDTTNKTLTLMSIPRDSWVPMLFDGQNPTYSKINTAYAFAEDPTLYTDRLSRYSGTDGPGNFTMDTVARLTGIPINYYLGMDFVGFKEMVDAVGGIDVNVPDSFSALYPVNDDASINAAYETVSFTQGPEHMTGARALEFARTRQTLDNVDEGSDFARSRRQRIIIEAFKARMLQPGGLVHLPQLLSIANQHVATNYAIPAAAQLSQLALDWKDVKIYQTALTTTNYLEEATGPEGTYAEVPSSNTHSWQQIQGFTKMLWDDPAAGIAMGKTPITVVNRSGSSGLATRTANFLENHGYLIASVTSDTTVDQSQLIAEIDDSNSALARRLAQDLNLPNLPTTGDNATSGQFTLELGADAADLALPITRNNAPSSAFGILKFGVWDPSVFAPPTSTPEPSRVVEPRPTDIGVTRTPTPVPSSPATPIRSPKNPNMVIVPKLIGVPEATAQQLINESGLMTTYVNYQTANDVADKTFFRSIASGAVLSQNPLPGAEVPPGTKVYLAVRKG